MRARRTVVFTGPTLPAEEVRARLPSADVRGPVAALDLLALDVAAGDRVAIIDGYYRTVPSVRHKEILVLLERGVGVVGASSMGALRAAEMAPLGMAGHGRIYHLYAHTLLHGDDEVAVVHGPADVGYPAMSEALVNIRYTARRAMSTGRLRPDQARALVEAAAEMPFDERRWPDVAHAALPAGAARRLLGDLPAVRVDVKAADARSLLWRLRTGTPPVTSSPGHRAAAAAAEHAYVRSWQLIASTNGEGISDAAALAAARLLAEDWPALQAAAVVRAAAAATLPDPDEREAERRCAEADGIVDLSEFLARNGMSRARYRRRAARWMATEKYLEETGRRPHALGARILEDARSRGVIGPRWPDWMRHWISAEFAADAEPAELVDRLVPRCPTLRTGATWEEPVLEELYVRGGIAPARRAVRAARAVNAEVARERPDFSPARLAEARVSEWLAGIWCTDPGGLREAALERGWMTVAAALRAAREHYMRAMTSDSPITFLVGPRAAVAQTGESPATGA